MTAVDGGEAVGQRPVRVGAIKVRILIDRFRLKPQAKLHPQLIDLLGKAGKTLRQLFPIHIVIAKTCQIIVAVAKPAVIQNKQLAAQIFGTACQIQQAGLVKIKHTTFPAVVQDRPFLAAPVFRHHMIHYKFVHPAGKTVKPAPE